MTLNDARSCPNCSEKVIDFIIEQSIVTDENKELSKAEIDFVCTAMLFSSIGLDNNSILDFFKSDDKKKIIILQKIRSDILDNIHTEQKQLDKIDHILRELTKGAKS